MGTGEGLAARLGFEADDRVAVVHVDDVGMCHAANEGAFEALEHGPATCGALMVPCPWFQEAAVRARANPALDLGVHLTLNAEWEHYRWGPVAGRSAVPSLVDGDGYLYRTAQETRDKARPEEGEIELRAQIDCALAAGVDVTHIDSHMGTVLAHEFVPSYAKLALEYGVPAFVVRPRPARRHELPEGFQTALSLLEAAGWPLLDGYEVDSLSFDPGAGLAHNRARIAKLRPGVSYLICHAAKDGEELRAIAPEAHCREFERTFYGGELGRSELAEAGVKTIGMREIRDLLPAA